MLLVLGGIRSDGGVCMFSGGARNGVHGMRDHGASVGAHTDGVLGVGAIRMAGSGATIGVGDVRVDGASVGGGGVRDVGGGWYLWCAWC
jgi:hypothetical protein